MSHSMGAIRFHSDGLIAWYEYDGTADIALPKLRETREEVYEHWRQEGWGELMSCAHEGEDADIASDYGGSFWWLGIACRECMVIKGPLSLEDLHDQGVIESSPAPPWSGFGDWIGSSDYVPRPEAK